MENSTFIRMIKVVLFGAGNVGARFYQAMNNNDGIVVTQWFNRSLSAMTLAGPNTICTNDLDDLEPADLYLLAVADDALPELVEKIPVGSAVVAHTAGSLSIELLEKHPNHGVLYPLQTLSKKRDLPFDQIPLCIEANHNKADKILRQIATALGAPAQTIDSRQRQALHVAAVFVNNFTNSLFAQGERLCAEHQVDFGILQPLILETAQKVQRLLPQQAQTGPAIRDDQSTIEKHLQLLNDPIQKKIYQLLTHAIQHKHD